MTQPHSTATNAADSTSHPYPTIGQAFAIWAQIGFLSFGGPAGQIALMHRIVVEENRWIGEKRFLHALNFCMLLPGPEAQQLAIYIGWLMHRTVGGIIAGVLFVIPGAIAIMGLSWIYALYGNVGFVEALFFGLKAAVLAIVLQALVRIGSKALRNRVMVTIAGVSFVAIYVFGVLFPLIVLSAGLIGYLGARLGVSAFMPGNEHGASGTEGLAEADSILGEDIPDHANVTGTQAMRIAGLFLLLWLAPVAILIAALGLNNVFSAIALFFSQMAVVTFGGAYAVLAYVAQEAVQNYGWLAPGEMLDGLGMAETTPGPLILVTQFVGFMGAFRTPGPLDPLLAGTLGAILTLWVTFTPCFAWIFLGAPYVERLRENIALSAALSTITAAVVGVILNLAVWFAIHVLFERTFVIDSYGLAFELPVWTSLDIAAALLVVLAFVAVFRFKFGVIPVLTISTLAGLGLHLVGLT